MIAVMPLGRVIVSYTSIPRSCLTVYNVCNELRNASVLQFDVKFNCVFRNVFKYFIFTGIPGSVEEEYNNIFQNAFFFEWTQLFPLTYRFDEIFEQFSIYYDYETAFVTINQYSKIPCSHS